MKIALFLSNLTAEAEAEISLLKRNDFEVEIFLPPLDSKKILSLRGQIDLVYVWQDIDLAGRLAQVKYILQVPLIYRQLNNWGEAVSQQTHQLKYLYREADRIILADDNLERDWLKLNLDIYERKETLSVADFRIVDLCRELINFNKNYDLTICFFGSFDQFYTRNRILLKGFAKNKVKVIKVNDRSPKLKKFWKLWQMHRKIKNDYDIMFVAFQGQLITPLAWLLARLNGKKVVLDALFSIYDAVVLDRREVAPDTFRAKFLHFLDWFSCRLADIVIVHTKFHKEFFIEEFGLKNRADKIVALYVGADNELLFPQPELAPKTDPFIIHFHGSYIPAQGLEQVIIGAAKILKNENVVFNLIGRGQNYQAVKNKAEEWQLNNVNFIEPVPYRILGQYMNKSDICLGSFGVSPKITRVVPLKVFEALACGRALITAKTPAILQLLTDKENCLLTELGDPNNLAQKILELKNNSELKEKIAQNGYKLYKENLTTKAIVYTLKNHLIKLNEAN